MRTALTASIAVRGYFSDPPYRRRGWRADVVSPVVVGDLDPMHHRHGFREARTLDRKPAA